MNTRVERKGLISLVKSSFEAAGKNPNYKGKWIESGSWLKIIQESRLGCELIKKMKIKQFSRLIKKEYSVADNNELNIYGVYMREKRIRNGRGSSPQKRITCFLVTEPDCLPSEDESQWYHFITEVPPQSSPTLHPHETSPATHPHETSPTTHPHEISPASHPPATSPAACPNETSPASSHHHQTHMSGSASTSQPSSHSSAQPSSHSDISTTSEFQQLSYFHSKEARKVFGYSNPKNDEQANKDIRDILYERIIKLQEGAFTYSGWMNLMEDKDEHQKCEPRFIYSIQTKAKYLLHALTILLESKEEKPFLTWQNCCELAISKIKEFEGANLIENEANNTHQFVVARTVMKWFREFRNNDESFVNSPYRMSLIEKDPPNFQHNPSLKNKFISFAKTNITGLTGEALFNHFHDQLIPELINEEREETGEILSKKQLLKQYGLTKLCIGTIYKWMASFGFKYCTTRKTYYVDGHEKPETVAYRKRYCNEYLHDELRCHRWIQLSTAEVVAVEKSNKEFIRDSGYEFKYPESGLTMFELHVDDLNNNHEKLSDAEFGGFLSVRKKECEKPIIMIGQDECIYKQYLLVKKQWILPDGTTAVNPKDEGMGIMLSSFCSRDFGYGFQLSPAQLDIVNDYRRGKSYLDEDAAMEILNKKKKDPLKHSPFVRKFEYGANSEGFWTYQHMVLQFEDVVDVLKALYGDRYTFLFFFDHSSGHD